MRQVLRLLERKTNAPLRVPAHTLTVSVFGIENMMPQKTPERKARHAAFHI
jgi:hypothetical protein